MVIYLNTQQGTHTQNEKQRSTTTTTTTTNTTTMVRGNSLVTGFFGKAMYFELLRREGRHFYW